MFKTYDKNGQVLFDSQKSVFSFIKSGRLTRLLDKTFQNNKREVWYRAKRLGINSKMRQRWADIYTPEYCMYYIDVDNPISPIASVYYDGLTKDCNPVAHLNTGFFDGKARMMFYSNGRLSDEELAKFQIYIFDNKVEKETIAGLNTYDKQGKLTFSSRSMPMSLYMNVIKQNIPNNIITLNSDEVKIINRHISHSYDDGVDYYYNDTGSDGELINKRKNQGVSVTQLLQDNMVKKCAGVFSPELIVSYYPQNSEELSKAIGDYNGFYQLKYSVGDKYPSVSNAVTLACIGTLNGAYIKPISQFKNIRTDGSTTNIGEKLLKTKLIFDTDVVSFCFADVANLPFPYN